MTMNYTAYVCSQIFDGRERYQDAALVVQGGRVVDICPKASLGNDMLSEDLGDGLLIPGLVDFQVNGGGGVMLNNAPTPATIAKISDAHARCGTTSLLPTLITDTPEKTRAAAAAVSHCVGEGVTGILGVHLEGPHLSVARKGAHDPGLIRAMGEDDLKFLKGLAASLPTLFVTVAPESVSNAQIEKLASAGAIVSLGHSDCSYATAVEAARHGATVVTHLFNAMSQLGSRDPGMIGAALETGELNAGMIADGFHIDPATIRIALRAKAGPGRIFLVSDAMATIGSDIRSFQLNGREILRDAGRLSLADGTLAGADIDLLAAVRFMIEKVNLDPDEAIRMASLYPAQVIGRSAEVGSLETGSSADFCLLDDKLRAKRVWRMGEPVN